VYVLRGGATSQRWPWIASRWAPAKGRGPQVLLETVRVPTLKKAVGVGGRLRTGGKLMKTADAPNRVGRVSGSVEKEDGRRFPMSSQLRRETHARARTSIAR
jgi:hypothetical protein